MSFRKRNVVVAQPGSSSTLGGPGSANSEVATRPTAAPGVRPSPLDGRLTTSTGTRSLDALLAGHSGLALGTSILIEESGTTDFGGALLRYYAAEGVLQGHHVHVLGMHEGWARELPGLSANDGNSKGNVERKGDDKMKIAWRYERLGEFGAGSRERNAPQSSSTSPSGTAAIFCHDFDLSKRLTLPSASHMHFVPLQTKLDFEFRPQNTSESPFLGFLNHLNTQLSSASPSQIHRVIIPNLLSPALYPAHASRPEHVLQFFHCLRALLRRHPSQVTAISTLPLTLHPRSSGLTRWLELLGDGVLELAPFPATAIAAKSTPGVAGIHEEPPQGMLKIHRLPVFHEKGGGGGEASGFGDDLAFTLSRRKGLVIKPYSLPPVEGDSEAQQGGLEHDHGKATKVDIEF